jgi:hypothetical protein
MYAAPASTTGAAGETDDTGTGVGEGGVVACVRCKGVARGPAVFCSTGDAGGDCVDAVCVVAGVGDGGGLKAGLGCGVGVSVGVGDGLGVGVGVGDGLGVGEGVAGGDASAI